MPVQRLLQRRSILSALALPVAALGTGTPGRAIAQDTSYPSRPVRMVIAFPPGGSSDVTARLVADRLAPRLGQPLVAENRPGGGAMIAGEAVARAQPDGHTIMFASSTLVISAATMRSPPIDLMRDLVPINNLVEAPMLLVASRNAPFTTLRGLVDYARANPGKLNIGVPGAGSSNHLGVELFIRQANITAEVVPYQGNAPQLTALIRGDIPIVTDSIATSMGFLREGTIRPLAVTSAQRSALLPEVPTVAEAAGLPNYATSFWFGLMAPKATPAAAINRLQRETAAVMAQPDVLTQIRSQGFEPVAFGAEQFGRRIAADFELWGRVAREAGVTPL
jgi:tripartite-type tricarboxylate transporter receptor subunit TctC